MSVLVAKEAPDFSAPAVMPDGTIKEDAFQFTEQYGEVCPAGWRKGETAMKPAAQGVAEYLSRHKNEL